MTSPRPKTPNRTRVLKLVATLVAAIMVFFVANTVRTDSQESASVSTSSLLTLPDAEQEPTATPTLIPTTAPIQVPTATATPAPTATAAPTATPLPAPTATTQPTSTPMPAPVEPTVDPAPVAVADAGATATEESSPAPTAEPIATQAPEPTATAVPEPTATPEPIVVAEPTAVIPNPTPQSTPTATVEPTATPEPASPQSGSTGDLEAFVLGEINNVRARAGLGPLALDPAASAIARDWSQQMAAGGFFEHRPSDQLSSLLAPGWRQWGENIASAPDIFWAQSSLEASPSHYENMVGPFTQVGIGVFSNGTQVWVTQVFVRY